MDEQPVFTFSYPEYVKYERGWVWYLIAGAFVAAFLTYSLVSANYLFGVIVILIGFLIILRNYRQPTMTTVKIGESGVWINDKLYGFREFQGFWIVYDPPITKNLYLDQKGWGAKISIPLDDLDPVTVRGWMRTKLKEDLEQKDEPMPELLSRVLKI